MSEKTRQITMEQACNRALDEALGADESVILLGEDIGDREVANGVPRSGPTDV